MAGVAEIIGILDSIAPFSLAESWDNSGLQSGSYSAEIEKILLSLNPTVKAVERAMGIGAQLLLTHHPLIFDKLSCINVERYPGNVLNIALKNSISLVAMHTNLDAAAKGLNHILAEMIGLKYVEILVPSDRVQEKGTGIGRIGNLESPKTLYDVSCMVKNVLGLSGLRVLGAKDKIIRRVAIVGGSGGSMLYIAKQRGADLFITGDIKLSDALASESIGLCLIDGTHFSTERVPYELWAEYLKGVFDENGLNVTLELFENEKDPMSYN